MAKITRKNAKIFGSSAGPNQIGKFGSLAAGSVAYTTDPEVIQELSNYLTGWFGAVVGANSPAIEDMNALCYLFAYQIAYLMQTGVPEWNDETTYYIGSMVTDSSQIYVSLTDDNLNNPVSDTVNWRALISVPDGGIKTGNYNLTAADNNGVIRIDSTGGSFNLNLFAATQGFIVTIKDVAGQLGTNAVTLVRAGTEKIENLAANFSLEANYGAWRLYFDGTNWWFL